MQTKDILIELASNPLLTQKRIAELLWGYQASYITNLIKGNEAPKNSKLNRILEYPASMSAETENFIVTLEIKPKLWNKQ